MSDSYVQYKFSGTPYNDTTDMRVPVYINSTGKIGVGVSLNLAPEEAAELRDRLTEALQVVNGYKVVP